MAYLRQIRVQHMASLLCSTDLSIAEVARTVGRLGGRELRQPLFPQPLRHLANWVCHLYLGVAHHCDPSCRWRLKDGWAASSLESPGVAGGSPQDFLAAPCCYPSFSMSTGRRSS
jgi:hypothetical protein